MSTEVRTKTIPAKKIVMSDDPKAKELKKTQALDIARERSNLVSLEQRVAGHHISISNFKPKGIEQKTRDVRMWTVDYCFPYSKEGPLMVDHAIDQVDFDVYVIKKQFMDMLGHRYLITCPEMNENEAHMQLESGECVWVGAKVPE